MRLKVLFAPVLSLALVSACGGGSQPAASSSRTLPESQVVRQSGLRRNPDATYRLAAHPDCVTPTLLRSSTEVRSYKAAGDVVVTNKDQSAGVKATATSPACRRLFAQALARVR